MHTHTHTQTHTLTHTQIMSGIKCKGYLLPHIPNEAVVVAADHHRDTCQIPQVIANVLTCTTRLPVP